MKTEIFFDDCFNDLTSFLKEINKKRVIKIETYRTIKAHPLPIIVVEDEDNITEYIIPKPTMEEIIKIAENMGYKVERFKNDFIREISFIYRDNGRIRFISTLREYDKYYTYISFKELKPKTLKEFLKFCILRWFWDEEKYNLECK